MRTFFFLHGFSIIKDIRIVQIRGIVTPSLVSELNAIPRKACRANFQTDKAARLEIRGTIRLGSWPANRHRLCSVSRVRNVSIVVAVIQLIDPVRIENRGGTSINRLTSLILFLLSSIIAMWFGEIIIRYSRLLFFPICDLNDKNCEWRLNNGRSGIRELINARCIFNWNQSRLSFPAVYL